MADRVFLYPSTDCSLTGLSSTQFFVKDILDTLGVGIQLIRHGKYKSAGEMYIRNDISEENRLQYETLLGSIWGSMTEAMAASRGLKAEDINAWVDGLDQSDEPLWVVTFLTWDAEYGYWTQRAYAYLTEDGEVILAELDLYSNG